ncbi:phosphotransferase, partial [Pelobium sp.]
LQELAMQYKTNQQLKQKIEALGEIYLAEGDTLLHGDYYPGSWLKTNKGLMVIDPEFAFYGRPEFDFAVLNAHLHLAQQSQQVFNEIHANYQKPTNFDDLLFKQLTGIEIMRRIIGLAQLPLSLNLTEKQTLLEEAAAMIAA